MSDFAAIDFNIPAITPISLNSIGFQIISQEASFTAAAAWPSSNLAIYVPFRVAYPYTANNMFWYNGSTVGTNTVDVGIYDSQNNQLVHSGTNTTSGSSAMQKVSITATTLQKGLYYMAMVMNGTTDTIFRANPANPMCGAYGLYTQTSASPLPSTSSLTVSATNYIPFFGITSSTVV